jgi:hypothetical protein
LGYRGYVTANGQLKAIVLLGAWLSAPPNAALRGQPAPSRSGTRGALTVGIVKDGSRFHEGGCELLLPTDTYRSERYVFLSDFDGRAVMNINGHDTKLTLVRSKEPEGEPTKGDRSSYWYSAGAVEVRVDYVVSDVCPPDDESCEVVYYTATIHVASRASKQVVAVYGLCGT